MQENKNLKVKAIEQEKTWGNEAWSLVLSCHLLQLQRSLTYTLSFLDLEGENETYTRTKET